MAENEQRPHEPVSSQPSNSLTNSQPPPPTSAGRPTISVPPRTSFEALLNGPGPGFSPGPMTLVSSFFSDSGGGGEEEEDCRSFSQLLAGALASPSAGDADFRLLSPMFSVLDSTGILSPGLGPFGMTHQQVLAHVTAQAAAQMRAKTENESDILSSVSNAEQETRTKAVKEPRSYLSGLAADNSKPNDDGYNWRKYGQKQVKGSEFPRSYYKCTHPSCPVKKKVERSLDGQVTEIIYKGQHCHGLPRSNKKRGKDVGNSNTDTGNHDLASQFQSGDFNRLRDQESSQATKQEQISGTSDSDEVGQGERDEDEPEPKRRHCSEPASSHRATTEPRIVVQTTSEVDLLEDGYRWRKYGQKVVKGNPYPRSYYKCTASGCNVRKHVERASTDQKAVITAYEGKHNHDVPAGKNSSHNAANQRHPQGGSATEHRGLDQKKNLKNSSQQPI